MKRCRDYAQIQKTDLTKAVVDESMKMLGVDALGLTAADRTLLHAIIEKYNGGPVGLNTLAASLSEEQATIEEFHEPYLIQIGLLERTPRGRTATAKSYEHLKIKMPAKSQEKLL